MKRSICAALATVAALIPLSLSAAAQVGLPFSINPFDSATAVDLESARRTAAVSSAEMAEKFLQEKQAALKVAQKRTRAMRLQMAKSALMTAKRMHSNGWCYKGVTDALKPLGVELSGPAAYMAKDLLKNDPRFQPVRIEDPTQLHPGDVIVHGPTGAHPYGHIAVYLGNNHEASDHVQKVVLNAIGPYSYSVVFRYDEELASSNINVETAAAPADETLNSEQPAEPADAFEQLSESEADAQAETSTTDTQFEAQSQAPALPFNILDFVMTERG